MGDTDFTRIKKRLLREGRLFEDPEFPANSKSIAKDGIAPTYIRWRRPKELVSDPKLIVQGTTRFDLYQGELGDCWFVAAAASLAVQNRKILERTVPPDQDFRNEYAGIFRFNFWRFDQWIEVIVDDRLPTVQGHLLYGQNRSEPNEFWVPLLEKAYAKIHGCYEVIDGGHINDALVDFTGGISERFDLTDESRVPKYYYELLYRTFRMNSMIGSSIRTKRIREEAITNGLYRGHAYSITAVEKIKAGGKELRMMRLRNPWGRGEWNGRWSDHSNDWNMLSKSDRESMRIRKTEGEFWMQYEDWLNEFDDCQICHLSPDARTEEVAKDMKRMQWREEKHHGDWIRGLTAGGCGNPPDQDLYWINPQFSITLKKSDDGNDDGKCTLVISLIQKDEDLRFDLYISFAIFKLRPGQPRLLNGNNYDRYALKIAARPSTYVNLREVCNRYVLDPGTYVIIPCTFKPHKESEFLLRVYSETPSELGPIDDGTRDNRPSEDSQEKVMKALYMKATNNDRNMDSEEFMVAVNDIFLKEYGTRGKFGIESARSLLAMTDTNRTGLIDFDEFKKMWKEITVWIKAFEEYDKNKSDGIETYELVKVFNKIGFSISRQVLSSIVRRYGGKRRRLSLEDFIHCLSRVVVMYKSFIKHSDNGIEGKAELSLEEWMAITLYY